MGNSLIFVVTKQQNNGKDNYYKIGIAHAFAGAQATKG